MTFPHFILHYLIFIWLMCSAILLTLHLRKVIKNASIFRETQLSGVINLNIYISLQKILYKGLSNTFLNAVTFKWEIYYRCTLKKWRKYSTVTQRNLPERNRIKVPTVFDLDIAIVKYHLGFMINMASFLSLMYKCKTFTVTFHHLFFMELYHLISFILQNHLLLF